MRSLTRGRRCSPARPGRRHRAESSNRLPGVKIGIVVPFSWSFWGAVVEHAELQAEALMARGHDVRLIMANDPPGQFTRALHPRVGRHGDPPPHVIPVGRSVIVPANGSLPTLTLSPRSFFRIRRTLERERFDVLHLHEPMTPAICVAVLAIAREPIVATHHASGELGWMRLGMPSWGFLMDRVDQRVAVSERARESADRWLGGPWEVIPNGVLIPPGADPDHREHTVVFAGRHEPRKGLQVLLRAWPEIHRRTGARLKVAGADPLAVALLMSRARVPEDGVDVVGFLAQDDLTALLGSTKALVAPSLGGESFGMVLTRAFACATPVVASDIPGYREVLTPETSVAVPPDDPQALADAVTGLLADEPRRRAMGSAARTLAVERYSWSDVAARLEALYEDVIARRRGRMAA
jgi:phosphatidyl-myo-inositol alpha-mannosyltransferase